MDTSQLGTQLSNDKVQKITAFLDGLTGDQPKVAYPVLPPIATGETSVHHKGAAGAIWRQLQGAAGDLERQYAGVRPCFESQTRE